MVFVLFRRLTDIRAARNLFVVARPKIIEKDDEKEDALARINRAKNEHNSVKCNMSGLTSIVGRKKKDEESKKVQAKSRWGKGIKPKNIDISAVYI